MARSSMSAMAKFWIILSAILFVLVFVFFVGVGIYSQISDMLYVDVLKAIFGISNDGTAAEVVTEAMRLTFRM